MVTVRQHFLGVLFVSVSGIPVILDAGSSGRSHCNGGTNEHVRMSFCSYFAVISAGYDLFSLEAAEITPECFFFFFRVHIRRSQGLFIARVKKKFVSHAGGLIVQGRIKTINLLK